jgi:hypothetical protein
MNITCGPAPNAAHIQSNYSSRIIMAYGTIKIAGNAPSHVHASTGSFIQHGEAGGNYPTYNVPASVNFSDGYIVVDTTANLLFQYAGYSGFGNVTGRNWHVSLNGVLNVGSDVPGNAAGFEETGGQVS